MSPTAAAKTIFVAAFLSASLTGVALARDPVFTAKLAAPVTEQTRVIAQSTIWNCVGDTCVARPTHAVSLRACRQFVREAGASVIAYGAEGNQLSEEDIARCNADLPATVQARN